MEIRTKESLATVTVFLITGILAAVTWQTYARFEAVNHQRQQMLEIGRGISELRMITLNYLINRNEQVRKHWHGVSDRIDHLAAKNKFSGLVEEKILARLLEDKARTQAVFEVVIPLTGSNKPRLSDKGMQSQQHSLLTQLLIDQPQSITEAFRLAEQANEPIIVMQQRMLLLTFAGLFLIALIKGWEAWWINRNVLVPAGRIQQAMQTAAQDLNFKPAFRNNQPESQDLEEIASQLPTLVAALGQEIAEHQKTNAALQASSRELVRSNSELAQFATVASHDMQEPLRMVTRYLHLLERHLAGKVNGEEREWINFAVDGAERMQKMVEGVLAYSRVTTHGQVMDDVDTSTALTEALALLAAQVTQTHAQVEAKALPRLKADYTQLVQLFQNLIGNALKYCRGALPQIRIEAQRRGDNWRFTVTDNGIGIAPQDRTRIFAIFQRLHTQQEYPGTGIGLAICKRIVERHGGEIGVEAAADGGSIFWFTLPAAEENT